MKGFFILILLSLSLVALFSYVLFALNTEIVSIDFLFYEVQVSMGSALLYFFLFGSFLTLILEILVKLSKREKINS